MAVCEQLHTPSRRSGSARDQQTATNSHAREAHTQGGSPHARGVQTRARNGRAAPCSGVLRWRVAWRWGLWDLRGAVARARTRPADERARRVAQQAMRGCQSYVCPAPGIERPTTIKKDTTTASAEDGRSKRWLDTAAIVEMAADVMNTTAADTPAVESRRMQRRQRTRRRRRPPQTQPAMRGKGNGKLTARGSTR